CGSPQMRNHIYCYAHRQMMEARALALRLPASEDPNAIQMALMRVQKALIDDHISVKKAGVLFYSLQLAITNVGQTTFGKANDEDLVTDTVEEQEAMREEMGIVSPQPIFTRDIPGLREYQKAFTAEGAENAEENKSLPRMEADNTDPAQQDGRSTGERDRSWGELPESALERDTFPGSFDPTPQREGRVGDPVFAPSRAPLAPACSG
ncbi:MAG TPA: hypothetical protein VFR84_10900, partial [Candidatus Angelobacter sp.]|nr:hypothetical protein [Candidatus Angelobacter sp.]